MIYLNSNYSNKADLLLKLNRKMIISLINSKNKACTDRTQPPPH